MALQPVIVALLIFMLGACVGSFVALAAYRLPRELSIVRPRSFCTNCHATLTVWQNVPILSWLILRGRCARCGASIGWRPFLTEIALGGAALWLALNFAPADAFARFILCAALFVIALIDFDWSVIYTAIPATGVIAGLLAAALVIPEVGWLSSVIGVIAGAGFLFLTGLAYKAIRHAEGIGLGDIYLIAMIGAFLGWPGVLFTLFAGSLEGSLGGLAMLLFDRAAPAEPLPDAIAAVIAAPSSDTPLLRRPIPFGPFLALAAALYALFQPQLLDWYLGH